MKPMTKERLAELLNGHDIQTGFPIELNVFAQRNNLVIVEGIGRDSVCLSGAISDEIVTGTDGGVVFLTKHGFLANECVCDPCPYHQRHLRNGLKTGEIRKLHVYWEGRCNNRFMNPTKYETLGKPECCFETTMPHVAFNEYDNSEGKCEFCCRGIVLDLDEIWCHDFTELDFEQGDHK